MDIPKVLSREARAKAPFRANHLRSKETNKAPQRASPPSSSNVKFALRSGAKGSSLSVDSGAYAALVPKDIPKVLSHEVRAKALSSANHLHSKVANEAPQCASLPGSLIAKFSLRGGAKRLSLGVDSGAYTASAPKGLPKVLSHEARAKALSSANHLCGDEKNRACTHLRISKNLKACKVNWLISEDSSQISQAAVNRSPDL